MKRIIAFAILALSCLGALAQTSTIEWHLRSVDPVTGAVIKADLGTFSTQGKCDIAAVGATLANTTVTYDCPRWVKVKGKVVVIVPAEPGASEKVQVATCALPLRGTWVQTRTFTLTNNVWVPSAWSPATPPTGACTAAPATETRQTACLAGTGPGTWPQSAAYSWDGSKWVRGDWMPAAPTSAQCPPIVTSLRPYVDEKKIPAANPGYSTARRGPAPGPFGNGDSQGPVKDDIGAVRMGCTFSHMNFDDPVIFAGIPRGSPHLHTFVGNTGANYASTSTTIAGSGNSTCSGGTLNRSAYWFPSLIDTTDGTPIAPSGFLVYYKTGYGGVKPADVQPVPKGLRFISGDAGATQADDWAGVGRYSCVGGPDGTPGVGWLKNIPQSGCSAGQSMIMEVHFPQCWDGVNLDSPDHKSHMAEATGTGCPKTHPVALPAISYEIFYDVTAANVSHMRMWRLSSDNYPTTSLGGYSAHGDYVLGWDTVTMETFIKLCDQASMDCHTNLMGDGTWLY